MKNNNSKDKEQISKIITRIDEGLSNLKARTDFYVLRYKDRVIEIETALEIYKKTSNPDALDHLMEIFLKTGAMMEGETSFDSTIWNANVQVEGKMTTLEFILWDLRQIVYKD